MMDKQKIYEQNMKIIYNLIRRMKKPIQKINNLGLLDDASYDINVNMEEMFGDLK